MVSVSKCGGLHQGAVTVRAVRHALQHRAKQIAFREVRGGEAADLLKALNTGHGGSLSTVHANDAERALFCLANCAMQGGGNVPSDAICRGVVDRVAMVIHMTRGDGRRVVGEADFVNRYDAGAARLTPSLTARRGDKGAVVRLVRLFGGLGEWLS